MTVYEFFYGALNEDGSYQKDPQEFRWSARAMLARAKGAGTIDQLRLGLAYVLQHDEIPIEKWGGNDVVPEEPEARAAVQLAWEQLWPGEDWRSIDTSDVTFV